MAQTAPKPGPPSTGTPPADPPGWWRWLLDATLVAGVVLLGWWLMGWALRRWGLLAPESPQDPKDG